MSHLYTATGDKGQTSLIGGVRISKNSTRLEAYGTIDELNSIIGLLIAQLPEVCASIKETLVKTQSLLFNIGAYLATPVDSKYFTESPKNISEETIKEIEKAIDSVDDKLPKLNSFVLPGGTVAASTAHIARTVCRRAERRILDIDQEISPDLLKYINRLSDYLFAVARFCNVGVGEPEIFWQP